MQGSIPLRGTEKVDKSTIKEEGRSHGCTASFVVFPSCTRNSKNFPACATNWG